MQLINYKYILQMRQVNKIRYGLSLPNSKKVSLEQTPKNSAHKLQKFNQSCIKPRNSINTIQRSSKINPYFPKTSQNKSKSNTKPTQNSTVQVNKNLIAQKLVSTKIMTDQTLIEKRIKTKNIRIRTQKQTILSNHKGQKSKQRNNYTRQSTQPSAVLLTEYQQNQAKIYQIYYAGKRRIDSDQDFTNKDGEPIVKVGDSIMFRYQILGLLGYGAFGSVFKACDHKRNQIVALKIIKNHPKYQKQAKVEINILQYVILHDNSNRSNIVKIKHAFLFRGHPCLIFQLLSVNLYHYCQQIKFVGLPLKLIRKFSIQILQALNFLEKHHIIHCDIKPENILLRRQNKSGVKLVDFGSGCFDGKQIYNYIQSRFYRAPQILLGIKYSSAIDIWSFGCVVVQLFNGCPIFAGQSQQDQLSLFIQTLGMPPQKILKQGQRAKNFFNGFELRREVKNKNRAPFGRTLQKILKRCSEPLFIDFVTKLIRWDPQERMKASQALIHPWIIQGIPEQLQGQHQKLI